MSTESAQKNTPVKRKDPPGEKIDTVIQKKRQEGSSLLAAHQLLSMSRERTPTSPLPAKTSLLLGYKSAEAPEAPAPLPLRLHRHLVSLKSRLVVPPATQQYIAQKHIEYISDPDVMLKEQMRPNDGTDIYMDHSRPLAGRSGKNIDEMDAVQRLAYKVKHRLEAMPPPTTFWITEANAKLHKEWAEEPEDSWQVKYWNKNGVDVPVVRASRLCVKHDLQNNGGSKSTPRTRNKREAELTKTRTQRQTPKAKRGSSVEGNLVALFGEPFYEI